MKHRDVVISQLNSDGEIEHKTLEPGKDCEWGLLELVQNNNGSIDWDRYLALSKWTALQAGCLARACCPIFWEGPTPANTARSHAHAKLEPERAKILGIIELLEDRHEGKQSPQSWARLLVGLGYSLPPKMAALVGGDAELPDLPPANKERVRSHTQERAEILRYTIEAIETRAYEVGYPLDRERWPGTIFALRAFLIWKEPRLVHLPSDRDRFRDDLRPLKVAFLRGAREVKGHVFYQKLYPNYPAR